MDPLRQANPPLLERKRLVGLSARALQSRVTVLSAGPGFGKSTLIDQWSQSQRAVFLTLSAADSSLPALGRSVSLANTHRRAERIATLHRLRR